NKSIPPILSDIVRKCLEIDPAKRFASATELLQAIESWRGPQAGTRVEFAGSRALPSYAKWGVAAIAVVLVAVFAFRSKLKSTPPAAHAPVSVLIADFDNKTGDAVFDGTLEPMMAIALEGAPFISSFNRGQARKDLARVQPDAKRLDDTAAR